MQCAEQRQDGAEAGTEAATGMEQKKAVVEPRRGTHGRSGEETVSCGRLHKFCWVAGTSPER